MTLHDQCLDIEEGVIISCLQNISLNRRVKFHQQQMGTKRKFTNIWQMTKKVLVCFTNFCSKIDLGSNFCVAVLVSKLWYILA